MAPFEELQFLWQNQPQPVVDPSDVARLSRSFRRYGRRSRWIYGVKLLVIGSLIAWALRNAKGSAPAIAGILLIAVVAGLLLWVDWRSQRALARLDFTNGSLDFIRHAAAELWKQREPFRPYYWPFLGSLAIGENLIFAFLMHPPSLWARFGWQLFGTAAPFAGYEIGRRIRIKRFESECLPILAQLRAIEESLQEILP